MRTNFLKTACLILLMLLTIIPNINAKTLQGQVYTGVVHDSENKPLIGVTVAIKGTGHGTTTDADGKFSITSSVSKPTLLFSYIGFEPVEVEPGNKPLIIKMKELDSLLKETVVIPSCRVCILKYPLLPDPIFSYENVSASWLLG